MNSSDKDFEFLLNADPLTDPDFDPDLCVEALASLVAWAIEDRGNDVHASAADMRRILLVTCKLFDHVDVWMRAGRKIPSRWFRERPPATAARPEIDPGP
jgi:hypothetical protein